MEGFKKQLIAQSSVRFMSVGDLTVDRIYPITKKCNQETQYGRTARCTLDDGLDGIIEVFLPRSIVVNDEQEALYNIDGNQTLSLGGTWHAHDREAGSPGFAGGGAQKELKHTTTH
ncbi:Uncharacterized protein FWK35_00026924 [Aphis craccivora]|uniref:Uncharacterized protein n=1 Tax=Aphis craccivora TaxID=307492 RepID=A0A6G0Y618_APHCR|nr:Uncharacterized protein FWK35_00026924 [Aphis craccivora]